MSKLGTHDEHPDSPDRAPTQVHYDVTVCRVCGQPAAKQCERCGRRTCDHHLMQPPRMHWETFRTAGPAFFAGVTWKRYIIVDSWHVCPECATVIMDENAKELAIEHKQTRRRRIEYASVLAFFIIMLGIMLVHNLLVITGHIHPIGPGYGSFS